MMKIVLRPGVLPKDGDLVLVHMGAGASDMALAAALRNFADYRNLLPGLSGAFTMSVFAAGHGVSIDDITDALPHAKFGTARFEKVSSEFDVWPTTITDSGYDEWLNNTHFDVILGPDDLAPIDPRFMREDQLANLREQLREPVGRALSHFEPRKGKLKKPNGGIDLGGANHPERKGPR